MKIKILLILLFTNTVFFAQNKTELYEIEKKLINGDKKALYELAPFFDSKKTIIEYLGHHILEHTESLIAKRLINENCIFLTSEITITEKTNTKDFIAFLDTNYSKINFSDYAKAFYITSLDKREVNFKISNISDFENDRLKAIKDSLLTLDWVQNAKIDSMIKNKNPKSLFLIVAELYKIRYRFNTYSRSQKDYMDLLRVLTKTNFATENSRKKLTWFIEKEFSNDAYLNLLIYFSKNYTDYEWNEKDAIFINSKISAISIDTIDVLFESLDNPNDSIAIKAFKDLTNCDPKKVIEKCENYQRSGIETNYSLPTFPYQFLKQLVVLTEYCRNNSIDYEGSKELKANIERLESKLTFKDRRILENKLINELTLENITAFEYWALLKEKSFSLTYSAGRILDVFYSKNWSKMMSNEKMLLHYLKKSSLFDNLGIIGVCNKYLIKFKNSNEINLALLNQIQTQDDEIKSQIEKAKKLGLIKIRKAKIKKKEFEGNKDHIVKDLNYEFKKIINDNSSEYEEQTIELLSKINYSQIGQALQLIENLDFITEWRDKYSFMYRDFGFFWIEDFENKNNRVDFLNQYLNYSEFDFYSYHLKQSGIDYLKSDNTFDYDKIYESLKYNVTVAFTGGGGGKEDNEVYPLIKLLEIKFKTTLGYPKKLCNSNGMYGCYSDDRAIEWMQFLIDKKLLKQEHNNPISFNYEY